MNELAWHDLAWCLRRAPRKVLEAVKESPGKVIIAGGFIRSCIANEEVNDIDLFASDADAALALANRLAPEQDRAKNAKGLLPGVHSTDNAYTITSLRPVAQVIHRWTFETPQQCVESFDFTIARAAIWYSDGWKTLVAPSFYADLAAKRLIYCSPKRIEELGGSMLRVLKFYQRGYRIPLDSLSAVIARLCSDLDQNKLKMSDEFQVSKILCGLLREVDPNIDPNHISHLPSQQEQEEQCQKTQP